MSPSDPLITFIRTPAEVDRERLEAFARSLVTRVAGGKPFACRITGDAELRRLNNAYLGHDFATDVLSFPAGQDNFAGDLAISRQRAETQAREFGHDLHQEIEILMLHGVLHLIGLDHDSDDGHMRRTEARWRKTFGLPAGLIEIANMTAVFVLLAFLLALGMLVVTVVQMLYLESQRLRVRDVPSMQFFKTTLSQQLHLEIEDGALAWSVIKHTLLLCSGMCVLSAMVYGGEFTIGALLQALATSWLAMMVSAYLLPQMIYRRSRCAWIVPLVPVLRLAAAVARPAIAVIKFIQSLLEIAQEPAEPDEANTPAENIDVLISAGAEEGLVEEEDRKLIQSVVEFGDKIVREVMTPRPNIVAIGADATLEQLRQLVINEQYSRIPLYEGTIDQIAGFVHVRDMFELEEDERAQKSTRDIMRPVRFVPETKPASDLMREMQQDGTHLVIVVDEYGNTAGLTTMEDLVEVILGEIRDEHEPDSDVQEDGNGGYIVSGSFDVGRLEDIVNFEPTEDIESTTIGGLVTEWLGYVPQPGQVIEREGIRVEVLASDEMRVEQVRVRKSEPAALSQKVEA